MGCLDEKMDLVSDFEKRHMDLGHLTSMGRNDFWDVIKKWLTNAVKNITLTILTSPLTSAHSARWQNERERQTMDNVNKRAHYVHYCIMECDKMIEDDD